MTFDQLIEQRRSTIERIIRDLARRHYLAAGETEEFRRVAYGALERNDHALLRGFEGKSTWDTYFGIVLTREFYTFQAALWGEWRPTPAAMHLGSAAVLLEELVVRDGFSVHDAVEWMRTTHRVDEPRHKLLHLAERLGLTAGSTIRSGSTAGAPLSDERIQSALRDAMALVSPDDRLILELRFRDHQPLTRIASMLKIDARPLQRRIETMKDVIRQSLMTQGIAAGDVEALLRHGDADEGQPVQHWWHSVLSGPSK